MSWRDSIDNGIFTITTGDGKVYTPMLKITETSKEFNAAAFDFINKEGSLVDRRKVKARKFPLLFYFQGENNITDAAAFDLSANDNRAWKVRHPFYGYIIGQPLSISRNDNNFNITEIIVDFWETITDILPIQNADVLDVITNKATALKAVSAVEYSNKVALKPADVTTVKTLSDRISQILEAALDAVSYETFMNVKNDVGTKTSNLILSPIDAMNSVSELIDLPINFNLSVAIRSGLILSVYQNAKDTLKRLIPNNKALFENTAGASVAALANNILRPQAADYVTRGDYELQAGILFDLYKDYQTTMDQLYIADIDISNKFSAGQQTQSTIRDIVITAIDGLAAQAFSAKQERIVIAEKDTNLILLTHKYMGLDTADENLEKFRAINNIRNKKLFSVKKGTQIKYYV